MIRVCCPSLAHTQPETQWPQVLHPPAFLFATPSAGRVELSPRFGQFHVHTDGPPTAYSPGGSPTAYMVETIGDLPGDVQIAEKAWLPDGQTLAFTAGGDLYLASAPDLVARQVSGLPYIQSIGWLSTSP